MNPYPSYRTYENLGHEPSVLSQEFPSPNFEEAECYYPKNTILEPLFATEEESRRFGAASFCGFLGDTIEVEQCLVIPAIAALRHWVCR